MEHKALKTVVREENIFDFPDVDYDRVRDILKSCRNFDILSYKDKYIKRRIAIRVRATHCATVSDYCELLLRNEGELDALLKGLTIHVSQFFRNRQTFESIRRLVFPRLFERCRREGRNDLTVWSVGCSSGEEPYTLAMILRDSFMAELKAFNVSIVATDVHDGVLDMAGKGVYLAERLQEVPEETRDRYFVRNGDKYHLVPEIKGMVSFRKADMFDIGSQIGSDLILCRNVLIYFERNEQERILQKFARSIRAGGWLVLGKAETLVGDSRRLFSTVCPIERIYCKSESLIY